jgi:hypothetical protein
LSLFHPQPAVSFCAIATPFLYWLLASEAQLQTLELIAPGLQVAYTLGLSRAMLVLAGMCVVGAAIVRVGLPTLQEE